ncbi:MAG: hypothetical protein WC882_02225 [Candidatus Gracilibacteria bacterium]
MEIRKHDPRTCERGPDDAYIGTLRPRGIPWGLPDTAARREAPQILLNFDAFETILKEAANILNQKNLEIILTQLIQALELMIKEERERQKTVYEMAKENACWKIHADYMHPHFQNYMKILELALRTAIELLGRSIHRELSTEGALEFPIEPTQKFDLDFIRGTLLDLRTLLRITHEQVVVRMAKRQDHKN